MKCLSRASPLPPNGNSLNYKCSSQAISFELQVLLHALAAALFRRSQPTGSRGFLAGVHLEFSWQLCLFMHLYFSLCACPAAVPSQSAPRTGPSCRRGSPPTPRPWWAAMPSSSARSTAMPSPTSSGSSTWRRTAANTGQMGCPTSRF